MSSQRYPEGYTVAVHSRAEAYPLQGWFVRRQTTTLRHPTLKQGAGCPRPPRCLARCAGGWVPRTAAIGGSGRGEAVVLRRRVEEGQCVDEKGHLISQSEQIWPKIQTFNEK